MKSSGGNDAWWQIVLQVFPTYLMAGCGMVGAGLILEMVQNWPAFVNVPEIIIVIPPLLGLKGNCCWLPRFSLWSCYGLAANR